jgi:hypothetical protein
MEILISIDGVLRNTIQKFEYHYNESYLAADVELESEFEYNITYPIQNDNLFNHFKFESAEEFEYFLFIEYPIEIFGHAGLSYSTTFTELHKMMFENQEHSYTLIGMDELGKSKPGTLFFLSKNGFLGNNIKFIRNTDIQDMWSKYDVWITDNKQILDLCPDDKIGIKFQTTYNQYFTYKTEIGKLSEIQEPWLKCSEKTTTLISMESQTNVE